MDDTGFPKDGTASPCVARQYSGTLGKIGNCQIGVSVHLVNERASCAADWRLFCPQSWDDQRAGGPGGRGRRAAAPRAGRHPRRGAAPREVAAGAGDDRRDDRARRVGRAGPGHRGRRRPAGGGRRHAGYGDNALFRQRADRRGWQYVVAVKGTTSAHAGDAVPQARPYGGLGRPPKPAYPQPPAEPAPARPRPRGQVRPVTWRQGTKATTGNPAAAMTSCFLAIRVRPASRHIPRAADGSLPACWLLAEWPPEADEPSGLLAVRPARGHPHRRTRAAGQDPLADRARLPRAENRPGPGPLRRPLLPRLAPPRHPRRPRPGLLTMIRTDPKAPAPG